MKEMIPGGVESVYQFVGTAITFAAGGSPIVLTNPSACHRVIRRYSRGGEPRPSDCHLQSLLSARRVGLASSRDGSVAGALRRTFLDRFSAGDVRYASSPRLPTSPPGRIRRMQRARNWTERTFRAKEEMVQGLPPGCINHTGIGGTPPCLHSSTPHLRPAPVR